jgi:hypothetical protein
MLRTSFAASLLAVLFLVPLPPEPRLRLCGFHWLTGYACPLCGLTRGLFALVKGHWSEAIHWNALSPLGLTMLLSLFWDHPFRARLWTVGIAAFGLYGVWRIL